MKLELEWSDAIRSRRVDMEIEANRGRFEIDAYQWDLPDSTKWSWSVRYRQQPEQRIYVDLNGDSENEGALESDIGTAFDLLLRMVALAGVTPK